MNKKKLALAIVGVALLSSSVTFAATYELPWTKNIYNVSSPEENGATVSVFDDGGNKCYVIISDGLGGIHSSRPNSISCVKR